MLPDTGDLGDWAVSWVGFRDPPGAGWVWLSVVAAIGLGFVLFVATGHDDAYITYWAARALAQHGEIVNYAGAPVEQSSSLLHVLALALLGRLTGAPMPLLGYGLGIAAGVTSTLRAVTLAREVGVPAGAWTALVIATVPVSLYWCFSGLETTLQAWLLVEVALVGTRLFSGGLRPFSPGTLLATAAYLLVRPESAFVLASALLACAVLVRGLCSSPADTASIRPLLQWALAVACLALAIVAVRLLLFGQPFPEPVGAKLGGSPLGTVLRGLAYVGKVATRPMALPILGAVVLGPWLVWRARRTPAASCWVLALIAAHLAFVVAVGGDWMVGGRFLAPAAPLCTVALLRALVGAASSRWLLPAVWGGVAVNLGGLVLLSMAGTGEPLWRALASPRSGPQSPMWLEGVNRVHERDLPVVPALREVVAALLDAPGRDRVVILSQQAGMVMYYTALSFPGRIEFVDARGLTSRHARRNERWAELGHDPHGIDLDVAGWLSKGLKPVPEVVFDVFPTASTVQRAGFTVVYEQRGTAGGWGGLLGPLNPRRHYSLYQYIAVRDDLLPQLPPSMQHPRRVDLDRRDRDLDEAAARALGGGGGNRKDPGESQRAHRTLRSTTSRLEGLGGFGRVKSGPFVPESPRSHPTCGRWGPPLPMRRSPGRKRPGRQLRGSRWSAARLLLRGLPEPHAASEQVAGT